MSHVTVTGYPSQDDLKRLNQQFDVLIEVTPSFELAHVYAWLMWLRNQPLSAWDQTQADTCHQVWLFPTPPHQWFSYVWVQATQDESLFKNVMAHNSQESRVGLIEVHRTDQQDPIFNQLTQVLPKTKKVYLPFLTSRKETLCKY